MSQRDPTPTRLDAERTLEFYSRDASAGSRSICNLASAYLALLDRVARLEQERDDANKIAAAAKWQNERLVARVTELAQEKLTLTDWLRSSRVYLHMELPANVIAILRAQEQPWAAPTPERTSNRED